jgi:arylsulfatase A-like enzyme
VNQPGRPNILVILADQLRRDALGIYGDTNVSTPHIDSMAASGVRFRNACSTYPICVPFRFTLMTGEYAHSRLVPGIRWRMSPAERTLADEFNDAGYETIYIGKWHLYGGGGGRPLRDNRTPVPRQQQGRWQRWLGFELRNDPYDTCYFDGEDPTLRRIDTYQTDGLFDLAMQHIPGARDRGRPFCCVISVEPPHPPFVAPDADTQRWRGRELKLRRNMRVGGEYRTRGPQSSDILDDLRTYYAMIENLDRNVGRIMRFLRSRELERNTVVVFLSDHGELLGCHGLSAKSQPYEESIGIPLIVADPTSSRRGGSVIEDPVCTEDLFPTLLGLANLEPQQPKPGMNLAPLIRGERSGLERRGVLLEFVAELRKNMLFHEQTWRGFRSRRHKYTVLAGEPWQFFDLQEDPYELNNLADDPRYSEEVRRHHHLLREELIATGDQYVLNPGAKSGSEESGGRTP